MYTNTLLDIMLYLIGLYGITCCTALGVVNSVLMYILMLSVYALFALQSCTWAVYYFMLTFITGLFMLSVYLASMTMNVGGQKLEQYFVLTMFFFSLSYGTTIEPGVEVMAGMIAAFMLVNYYWTIAFGVGLFVLLCAVYYATKSEGPFRESMPKK